MALRVELRNAVGRLELGNHSRSRYPAEWSPPGRVESPSPLHTDPTAAVCHSGAVTEIWITLRTPNRRPITVLVDGPLVVGRDCDGLILADQRVSRRHTCFEPDGDRVRVTDLDSSNGTAFNGGPITEPVNAGAGDVVTVGNTTIAVQVRTGGSASAVGDVPTELATVTPSAKTSIERVAEAVQKDGPASYLTGTDPMARVVGGGDDPGTLTVVFSDIESSTELALALGDARWFEVLGEHHRLVTAHVDAHRGRIVKNQGDGYMLCFRSARQALLASIGLQRDLARETGIGADEADGTGSARGSDGSGADGARLRVRMGVHTGEVMMQDDGDLFGKHVIVAARVGALAEGGQILVSNLVKQIAEPRGDIRFGPAAEAWLKGIDGPTLVHEVDWAAALPDGSG